jgi:hypothetical protein
MPTGPRQAIDPEVITRLRVEVSAADIPVPVTAEVTNVSTDTVSVALVVPMGSNRLIAVTAFNGFDVETFRGDLTVDLTQTSQAVEIALTPQASTNPAVSGLISAATGGLLEVTDERTGLVGTTLVVPPGALASDTTLALGTTNNPDLLPALPSRLEGMGLVLVFSPSGTTFRIPAILTLPYDPAAVAALGLTERTLRFFVLEDGAQAWQEISGTIVDTDKHRITVPLSSFSQGSIAGGGNRPPQLHIPSQTVDEGQTLTVRIKATDPDGDTLTLTTSSLPAFASLTDNGDGSGRLILSPDFSDAGSVTVTLTATDAGTPPLSTSQTIGLTVINVNRPPPFDPLPSQTVDEGQTLTILVIAIDPDGDALTLTASGLPTFASFTDTGNGTGRVILMPASSDAGSVTVSFTATDAGTPVLSTSRALAITITNPPPVLTNPGNQSHAEGEAIGLQMVATDPDRDPLTFSATGLPTELSIDAATGRITGTIARGAAAGSPYSSVVTVTDGTDSVSTTFSWTVASRCPPDTVCIEAPPGPVADTFKVTVAFNAGATSVASYLFELTFDPHVVEVLDIEGLAPFDDVITNQLAFPTGKVRFAAHSSAASPPTTGLLTLANITFQVVGNSGDTSALAFGFPAVPGGQGVIGNTTFQPIATTIISGSVKVQ